METINISLPGALYSALYERYREDTTTVICSHLEQLLLAEASKEIPEDNEPNRPRTGTITGRVWEIADKIFNESGEIGRDAVIKACMLEGINFNTANTQFSYWKKSNAKQKAQHGYLSRNTETHS